MEELRRPFRAPPRSILGCATRLPRRQIFAGLDLDLDVVLDFDFDLVLDFDFDLVLDLDLVLGLVLDLVLDCGDLQFPLRLRRRCHARRTTGAAQSHFDLYCVVQTYLLATLLATLLLLANSLANSLAVLPV